MSSLYSPIRSRMVRWCKFNIYVKSCHNVPIEVANKAVAVVGNRRLRDTKPLHPVHEGSTTLHARGRLHGVGLQPPGGPTEHREQEPLPC